MKRQNLDVLITKLTAGATEETIAEAHKTKRLVNAIANVGLAAVAIRVATHREEFAGLDPDHVTKGFLLAAAHMVAGTVHDKDALHACLDVLLSIAEEMAEAQPMPHGEIFDSLVFGSDDDKKLAD